MGLPKLISKKISFIRLLHSAPLSINTVQSRLNIRVIIEIIFNIYHKGVILNSKNKRRLRNFRQFFEKICNLKTGRKYKIRVLRANPKILKIVLGIFIEKWQISSQ